MSRTYWKASIILAFKLLSKTQLRLAFRGYSVNPPKSLLSQTRYFFRDVIERGSIFYLRILEEADAFQLTEVLRNIF